MALHVYIDGEFYKQYESTQDLNADKERDKDREGELVVSGSELREDGDHNVYLVTIKE